MVIISKTIVKEFMIKHPGAAVAIEKWYEETAKADWRNFAALKATFNTADAVGNNRYVFNIKGNYYRLIALILFNVRTVFILFVGTHGEYDKLDAARVTFKS